MKSHIGVGTGNRTVYAIKVTVANERNVTFASRLIREDDEVVYSDFEYLEIQKQKEIQVYPRLEPIGYRINRCPKSFLGALNQVHIERRISIWGYTTSFVTTHLPYGRREIFRVTSRSCLTYLESGMVELCSTVF